MSKLTFNDIEIIFDHKDFLVINKPYNLACQGGVNVKNSIDKIFTIANGFEFDCKLVHRLDKHTSGALILAKYKNSAAIFTKLFQNKQINKEYLTFVKGKPNNNIGEINYPLVKTSKLGREIMCVANKTQNSKHALTHYQVIDYLDKTLSLMKIIPITGRKHQIRVHLSAINHPIIGDGKYGGKNAFINNIPNKLLLHCNNLNFQFKSKPYSITAKLPIYFQSIINEFGLNI